MQCDHKCQECGEHERGNWSESHAKQLAAKGLCSSCAFWMDKVEDVGSDVVVRVDGRHYRIADEHRPGMRGFEGQRFKIRFFDGRAVTTTNLWSQGEIPKKFRDRLPDNAEFL